MEEVAAAMEWRRRRTWDAGHGMKEEENVMGYRTWDRGAGHGMEEEDEKRVEWRMRRWRKRIWNGDSK